MNSDSIKKILANPNLTDEERNFFMGRCLSDEDAQKIEEQLVQNENNYMLHIQILGYCFAKPSGTKDFKSQNARHALWVINNHPDYDPVLRAFVQLFKNDGKEFVQAEELWEEKLKINPDNAKIILNAAHFLRFQNALRAEQLFCKGQSLEPDNPEWLIERARLLKKPHKVQKNLVDSQRSDRLAYDLLQKAFDLEKEDKNRFYLFDDLARAAFDAEDFVNARKYAEDCISSAYQYKKNWNYGNAVHHGNLLLGRLALKEGNLDEARERLLKAAREIPNGSPKLSTFGPNMTLAKELLELGEKEIVLQYFELCEKFWNGDIQKREMSKWKEVVNSGNIPNFGGNLYY